MMHSSLLQILNRFYISGDQAAFRVRLEETGIFRDELASKPSPSSGKIIPLDGIRQRRAEAGVFVDSVWLVVRMHLDETLRTLA